MVYIVLAAGLIIIFAALKKDNSIKTTSNFKDMLKEKTEHQTIDSLVMQINELNERVDELENALLLYQPEFNSSITKTSDISVSNTLPPDDYEVEEITVEQNRKIEDNNSINNQIYSLFDSGRTIEEIASCLNTGKGEISLRLGLRKQKI